MHPDAANKPPTDAASARRFIYPFTFLEFEFRRKCGQCPIVAYVKLLNSGKPLEDYLVKSKAHYRSNGSHSCGDDYAEKTEYIRTVSV
jgi:hypothetical protein